MGCGPRAHTRRPPNPPRTHVLGFSEGHSSKFCPVFFGRASLLESMKNAAARVRVHFLPAKKDKTDDKRPGLDTSSFLFS